MRKGPQCCLQGTPRRDFRAISTCRKHSDYLGQEPLTGKVQSTGLAAGVGEGRKRAAKGQERQQRNQVCKSLWREEQWSRDHQRQTTRKPKRMRANGSWISPLRSLAPSRGNKPDFEKKKRAAEKEE